jgi:hypothetical protein
MVNSRRLFFRFFFFFLIEHYFYLKDKVVIPSWVFQDMTLKTNEPTTSRKTADNSCCQLQNSSANENLGRLGDLVDSFPTYCAGCDVEEWWFLCCRMNCFNIGRFTGLGEPGFSQWCQYMFQNHDQTKVHNQTAA